MKFVLVAVLVLAGIGAVFLLRNPNNDTQTSNPVASPNVESSVEGETVEITPDGFSPETITVSKGTTVTFVNKDADPHRVASDDHPIHDDLPGFDSDMPLRTNETYSFTFEKIGTFTYHDHLNHLDYKGTVVVTD